MDGRLTIKDVAKRTGIPATTLRYWGKRGLLDFAARDAAGSRVFSEDDFEAILIIHTLKETDMPLEEIRRFIGLYMAGDSTIAQRRAMYEAQRESVRKRIAALEGALGILDYKCWYMGEAERRGDAWWFRSLPEKDGPERVREFYEKVGDYRNTGGSE